MDKLNFNSLLEEESNFIKNGEVIVGEILKIERSVAVIQVKDFLTAYLPIDDIRPHFKKFPFEVGQKETFVIKSVDNGFGEIELSYTSAKMKTDEEEILKSLKTGDFLKDCVVQEKIVAKNSYIIRYGMFTFFMPSSLTSRSFELNDKLNVVVKKFSKFGNSIVSEKDYVNKFEKQINFDECFAGLKVGQKIKGTVKKIVEFGAFVDIGFTDALVHKHEASWDLTKDFRSVLKDNAEYTFYIYSIDYQNKKVNLTLKDYNSKEFKELQSKVENNHEKSRLFTLKLFKNNGIVISNGNLSFYIKNKDLPSKSFAKSYNVDDYIDLSLSKIDDFGKLYF